MSTPLEQIRSILRVDCQVSDDQLIERFLVENDADAFAELVRRYGSLVFRTCRRILRHQQDAEDAFQAVFLVLAHKAGSVCPRERLPVWLHGVACRTALKARSLVHKRQSRETSSSETSVVPETAPVECLDWIPILYEEVQRLPEKYRLPILLCELEGRARRAVAELLDWPEGTVAGRLHRAKELLARRLTKRGVTLSVAALATWLSGSSTHASVHLSLQTDAIRASTWARLGDGGSSAFLSSTTQTLAQGVIKMMTSSKWKSVMTCLMLLTMTLGVGLFGPMIMSQGQDRPATTQANDPKQAEREPIQPMLVLQEEIQKELRLSPTQINNLKAAYQAGIGRASEDHKRSKELDQQIKEMEKKLELLRGESHRHKAKVGEAQKATLKEAIFEELSDRAVSRSREITLHRMRLNQLLSNAELRDQLKLNDEQVKEMEKLLSKEALGEGIEIGTDWLFLTTPAELQSVRVWSSVSQVYMHDDSVQKILTPEQRKLWEKMGGEPSPQRK